MEYFNLNIYPVADLIIKIIIGIIIVIYLNRRTYRDKIKDKLIDSYMEYLDKFKNFSQYELFLYQKEFYKQLVKKVKDNLVNKDIRNKLIENINIEIKNLKDTYDDNCMKSMLILLHILTSFVF